LVREIGFLLPFIPTNKKFGQRFPLHNIIKKILKGLRGYIVYRDIFCNGERDPHYIDFVSGANVAPSGDVRQRAGKDQRDQQAIQAEISRNHRVELTNTVKVKPYPTNNSRSCGGLRAAA
jgi:hypothetical protein